MQQNVKDLGLKELFFVPVSHILREMFLLYMSAIHKIKIWWRISKLLEKPQSRLN